MKMCSDFKYCVPYVNVELIDVFDGTLMDKDTLFSIFGEWNNRTSVSGLCESWMKVRPSVSSENLKVLLWKFEGLSTHLSDFNCLLSSHTPHIFILTGVGKQISSLHSVPNYRWFSQSGTNSFGGVAVLVHSKLKCSVVDTEQNFFY